MKTEMLDDAEFVIGYRFDSGLDVPQSIRKAIFHYQRAANNGNVFAQYNLGQLYSERGKLFQQRKAVYWWSKAAGLGYSFAKVNLGNAYEQGRLIKRNIRKAKALYSSAAKSGDLIATYSLARLAFKSGKQSEAQATFRQLLPKLKKLSRSRNGDHGGDDAKICLAMCAYNGWGVEQSKREAIKWYRAAAKKGVVKGLMGLGYCYEDGDGVKKNLKKAQACFAKARSKNKNGGRILL